MKRAWLWIAGMLAIALVVWIALYEDSQSRASVAAANEHDSTAPRDVTPLAVDAIGNDSALRAVVVVDGANSATTASAENEAALIVRGRVVDERRFAVAGADVSLQLKDLERHTTRSGSDGSFAIALAKRPAGRGAQARVSARRGDTTAGVTLAWIAGDGIQSTASGFRVPSANPREVDVGTIALVAASRLRVSVRDGNAPGAGARVLVDIEPRFPRMLDLIADANGEVTLDPLPVSALRFRAVLHGKEGRSVAFVPQDKLVTIELQPSADVELVIVNASNGAAIPGAKIEVRESYTMSSWSIDPDEPKGGGEIGTARMLDDLATTSDALGHAHIRIPNNVTAYLTVTAPGYQTFPAPEQSAAPLASDGVEKRIELLPTNARTVRWPIVAGEVPPPPNGSTVAIHLVPGMTQVVSGDAPLPPPGHMEGSTLVVDQVEGWAFVAEAEDGALAKLRVDDKSTAGLETSFRRGRRIEVLVHDSTGVPVSGVAVNARDQGNRGLCDWVLTDADGRAWLSRLYGGLVDVYVARAGETSIGKQAGSVNLDQGDGRVEYVLPELSTAAFRTLIDGEPRLPAKFAVRSEGGVRVIDEDPERGIVRIELTARVGETKKAWLQALGFLDVAFDVMAGELGAERVVDIALRHSGSLIAEVRLPADGDVAITAQHWNDEEEAWGSDASNGASFHQPNGPAGTFVFAGLEPGRWRVLDKASGLASDEALITPQALEAHVYVDLASVQWVSGRVEAPPDTNMSSVVILIESTDAAAKPVTPGVARDEPAGRRVAKDGSFRVNVPGDRTVTLRPSHPWLSPAREGGTLSTREGREGVVLKLEAGDEIRLPVPQLVSKRDAANIKVGLYRGRVEGEPERVLVAPIDNGVARFGGVAPGRWTLWIDPRESFAPLVIDDVEVKSGVTELAPARFESGSSIRVRVQVAEGASPPLVYAYARCTKSPQYTRSANSGRAEFTLPGLGAGSFEITIDREMNFSAPPQPRVIELDGRSEIVLDLDAQH